MPDNRQPSLGLAQAIQQFGIFPHVGDNSGVAVVGSIRTFAFDFTPYAGLAAGQLLSTTQNSALFSLLGTRYGGNGTTNFALPNLSGRIALDVGTGPGLSNHVVGQVDGSTSFALTQANLTARFGGTSSPLSDLQPSLTTQWSINTQGFLPSGSASGTAYSYLGAISQFAGNFPVDGLPCDGRLLQISSNVNLFSVLGTTYGGNGTTTFALPDLRGRTAIGMGQGVGLTNHALGEVVGVESVTFNNNPIPTAFGGGGAPINNMQPSLALNYCICVQGIFPSQGDPNLAEEEYIGEILAFAFNAVPPGFLRCDGQMLLISQNGALFALIGTTYGGDGITTFALPDLRGRTVIGIGTNGGDTVTLGQQIGAESVTLTASDIPALNITGTPGVDQLAGGNNGDTINGLAGDDQISSYGGNDTIDGGTGNDTLRGGLGNDTYYVDVVGDVIIEMANEGTDEVRTALQFYALSANVENVTFTDGTAHYGGGNSGDNVLTGNTGRDELQGFGGNDTLNDGGGVVGSEDTLIGGPGNDTYLVTLRGDSVIELVGEGIDEVRTASRFYYLSANVENLTFTDGTLHSGIGNASDNVLTGNTGRDELQGFGGNDTLDDGGGTAGNEDTLIGGAGNDIYLITLRGDSVLENVGEGNDEVRTGLGIYILSDNVELLTFTNNNTHIGGGNASDNVITGGTGADELLGYGGNDTLMGGAGAANTLLGGTGDDLFIVSAIGDSVIEYGGEGTDTVQTALSVFFLRANVENLIYTGSAPFSGVGSADNNMMTAGAGADFLNGNDGADILIGGSGADLLLGGDGADQFRYLGGETGYDRIIDFTPGTDKIALANTGFAHTATIAFIATGAPVATSANSTFLYDVNSGILSYDADGNGAGAAVQLAQLNTGLTLSLGDFIFV